MDKKIDHIVKQYVSAVASQTPGFVTAYLFGSFARNNQTPERVHANFWLMWQHGSFIGR
jgi:predicted nucleotidyltransferase